MADRGCYLCRPDDPNAAEEGCAVCDREFYERVLAEEIWAIDNQGDIG